MGHPPFVLYCCYHSLYYYFTFGLSTAFFLFWPIFFFGPERASTLPAVDGATGQNAFFGPISAPPQGPFWYPTVLSGVFGFAFPLAFLLSLV